MAPDEEQTDLNLCLSSSHRSTSEEVPASCAEQGETKRVLGPGAARDTAGQAHLHPTAPVHQPEPQPALNCKCFCIFSDINNCSCSILQYLTLGEAEIILNRL